MSTGAALLAGMAMGTLVTVSIVSIVIAVLEFIALWKIFTKAGEKGWKALIPFYNLYILIKISWDKKFFWISLAMGIVVAILTSIPPLRTNFVVGLIALALAIALLVIAIIGTHRLSQAFGHGAGWTVGLIFLQTLFVLMLAFGKSEYKGNVYLELKN